MIDEMATLLNAKQVEMTAYCFKSFDEISNESKISWRSCHSKPQGRRNPGADEDQSNYSRLTGVKQMIEVKQICISVNKMDCDIADHIVERGETRSVLTNWSETTKLTIQPIREEEIS